MAYASMSEANKAADEIKKRNPKTRRNRAYECKYCDSYHLSRWEKAGDGGMKTKAYKQRKKEEDHV